MNVQRIGVIGAGTMGHGIAQAAALAAFDTTLYDLNDDLVAAGIAKIRASLERGVERGKIDAADAAAALARIAGTGSLATLASADLVVEAAPEDLQLKRDIFARLASICGGEAILASNTSSLSVAAIAAGLKAPERVLGMHFFNPVPVMKLLEIVRHDDTSAAAVATATAVGERLGKTSIVVRDTPGFATSRLGLVLGLEAMRMLEEGVASAADIDTAMELGYRHPMGPLKLTDLIGLDVRLAIATYLHEQLGAEAFRPPGILRRLVAAGKLGRKSGEGFYEW